MKRNKKVWFLHNSLLEHNSEIKDIVRKESIKVTLNQLFRGICLEQFKQEQISQKSNRIIDANWMLNVLEPGLKYHPLPYPLNVVAGDITMFLVLFFE